VLSERIDEIAGAFVVEEQVPAVDLDHFAGAGDQVLASKPRTGRRTRRIYLGTVDAAPIRISPRDPPWSENGP